MVTEVVIPPPIKPMVMTNPMEVTRTRRMVTATQMHGKTTVLKLMKKKQMVKQNPIPTMVMIKT
jgi:hypothetical protein